MKFSLRVTALLAIPIALCACKERITQASSFAIPLEKALPTTFAPKQYQINFKPSKVKMGANNEIFIQYISGNTTVLQKQGDSAHGTRVTFNFTVSNKSSLSKKSYFFVSRSEALVELSNGMRVPITAGEGFSSPDPAMTSPVSWSLTIPNNTMPVKLLMYNEGRKASIKLALTEKKTDDQDL